MDKAARKERFLGREPTKRLGKGRNAMKLEPNGRYAEECDPVFSLARVRVIGLPISMAFSMLALPEQPFPFNYSEPGTLRSLHVRDLRHRRFFCCQ